MSAAEERPEMQAPAFQDIQALISDSYACETIIGEG